MSRLLALLVTALVTAGGLAPAARAQATDPSEAPRRGPDALWEAFPLEQRPPNGDGAVDAAGAPLSRPGGGRVAFLGEEPAGGAALTVATALCVVAGLLLCVAGLRLVRGHRRMGPGGRGGSGLPGIRR